MVVCTVGTWRLYICTLWVSCLFTFPFQNLLAVVRRPHSGYQPLSPNTFCWRQPSLVLLDDSRKGVNILLDSNGERSQMANN